MEQLFLELLKIYTITAERVNFMFNIADIINVMD